MHENGNWISAAPSWAWQRIKWAARQRKLLTAAAKRCTIGNDTEMMAARIFTHAGDGQRTAHRLLLAGNRAPPARSGGRSGANSFGPPTRHGQAKTRSARRSLVLHTPRLPVDFIPSSCIKEPYLRGVLFIMAGWDIWFRFFLFCYRETNGCMCSYTGRDGKWDGNKLGFTRVRWVAVSKHWLLLMMDMNFLFVFWHFNSIFSHNSNLEKNSDPRLLTNVSTIMI